MKDDIQQIVDRFNNIYLSVGTTSIAPIKLYFNEENYQKIFDDDNYKIDHEHDKQRICTVEFFLKHKILEWKLYYFYGYEKDKEFSLTRINELKSYVVTQGLNLADDEYTTIEFETLQAGAEFIKNQIIKTYEKFQKL